MLPLRVLCGAALWYALSSAAIATADGGTPVPRGVGIRERLGERLDLDLVLRDERGKSVRLGQFFDGRTPVLLTLNYYRCRTLCDLQLVRLGARLAALDASATPYRALSISIDPRDTPEQARAKRAQHGGGGARWRFLLGGETAAQALAEQLGVSYRYDPRSDQYAHPPALFAAAPDGRLARVLYGVDYAPRDVRFALIEAAEGRTGSSVDKVLMTCFQYDRSRGRYGPYVLGLVRAGGVVTVLGLAAMIVVLRRGELRRSRRP